MRNNVTKCFCSCTIQ